MGYMKFIHGSFSNMRKGLAVLKYDERLLLAAHLGRKGGGVKNMGYFYISLSCSNILKLLKIQKKKPVSRFGYAPTSEKNNSTQVLFF